MKAARRARRGPVRRPHFVPRSSRTHASESPFELCGLDHELERLFAVDFDHWDALPVQGFERRVACDVDLFELERLAALDVAHDGVRLLAQVTAGLPVERELGHDTLKGR